MFEDFLEDYAKRKIGFEIHPHTGIFQLSVHPGSHASAMKKIIDISMENDSPIEVHQAFFIFLKEFSHISSMVFDYSTDVQISK